MPTLTENSTISNTADIFFDYNYPIVTNEAKSTYKTLAVQDFVKDNSIKFYLNPASDKLTIEAKNTLKSVNIYDLEGRIIEFIKINEQEKIIDISKLSLGVYFIDIATEKGRIVEKLVKK